MSKTRTQNTNISGYKSVVTSTLVSVGDVTLNLLIAAITGSSVMLAQGLQGSADLLTTLMLLIGVKRSKKAASPQHPFGYGRELFFWVLIASLFAFLVNGGIAIARAWQQIADSQQLESTHLALVVLTFGTLTNGYSLSVSLKRLRQHAHSKSLWSYIRHSSLVETKMTLLVDLMGTSSAVLGLLALGLYVVTGNPLFDGLGALVIGAITAAGALFVIADLHDLIVGRSPQANVIEDIRGAALNVKGVNDVLDLRAATIGSGQVLAILEVHFIDNLTTDQIEVLTDNVKAAVIKAVPQVTQVQVEAETPDSNL